MRTLQLIAITAFAVVLYAVGAQAQSGGKVVGSGPVIFVSTAPSGACTPGASVRVTTSTGDIYTCKSRVWTIGSGGGGGGSSFTGGALTSGLIEKAVVVTFSATPTIDLSLGNRFEMTLTGNVTSVTLSNKGAGQKFSIAWKQDGSGAHTLAYGGSAVSTCPIQTAASAVTTQDFDVASDATTVYGKGCTATAGALIGGSSQSDPGAPGTGNSSAYGDSTANNWEFYVGSTKSVAVIPQASPTANQFVTNCPASGICATARPTASNIDVSADNTDGNVTTGHRGFMPKLDGNSSHCYLGDGTQAACPGGFNILDQSVSQFSDDFLSPYTNTSSAIVFSSLSWLASVTGSTGTMTLLAGVNPHPGILQIESGPTAAQGFILSDIGFAQVAPLGNLASNTNWELDWIWKLESTTSVNGSCGLRSNSLSVIPNDEMSVRFDNFNNSDTSFTFISKAGGTPTTSTTNSIAGDTNWHRTRIRSLVAGTILFSIDGGTETSISTNVPTVSMAPYCIVQTGASAAKDLDVDWVGWKMTGLSR